jgi:hypothetical protein
VELLAVIAIIAIVATALIQFVASYTTTARETRDAVVLRRLNDALESYKVMRGGVASALTLGTSTSSILNQLRMGITVDGTRRQFFTNGFTMPARSVDVLGTGSRYRFTRVSSVREEGFTPNRFVAVANYTSAAAYSNDGIVWTAMSMPSFFYWQSIAYGNGRYAAVCNNGNIAAYSSNGINWTATTMPSSSGWTATGYNGTQFLSVAGWPSTVGAVSSDGTTWSPITMPQSQFWGAVVSSGSTFVVGASGYIATGSSGATLAMHPTWLNGVWSAGASGNGVTILLNGATAKTARLVGSTLANGGDMPVASSWRAVTFGEGRFVAVARGTNTGAYSTDGVSWTATTLPATANWRAVAYGNGKFVAIAEGSTQAAYSDDGITWLSTTMPSSANWYAIAVGDR